MLLIQSDMMKAMWLVLCPLVYFSTGSLDNEYYFCQVSGFLLTVAIEASDIAVLMIAIHQALYVLNSHEGGLYPYRKIAYIVWAVLPIVIAAVVPISGGRFIANGPNCYLPVHPGWYRQALSWGPRYFIFGLISIIYASVYLYVGLRFRRFGKVQRSTSTVSPPVFVPRPGLPAHEAPPTPSIMDHGLLDSARDSLQKSVGKAKDERQDSVTSTASTKCVGDRQSPTPRTIRPISDTIAWNLYSFEQHDNSLSGTSQQQPAQVTSLDGIDSISPVPMPTRPARAVQRSATQEPTVAQHREAALVALTRSISAPADTTTPSSWPWQRTPLNETPLDPGVIHLSADATGEVMRRSRERTHRQLRLLVVYPIIYIASWIAPFISHALGFDDNVSETTSGPFELQVASIASFCIGAAVDCSFFMGWEKPWRELQGGFWEGLGSRLGSATRFFRQSEHFRPHVQRDARMAHFRRAQEDIDRGVKAATMSKAPPRRPREWWDEVDMDNEGGSKGGARRPVSYHLGASEMRRDLP